MRDFYLILEDIKDERIKVPSSTKELSVKVLPGAKDLYLRSNILAEDMEKAALQSYTDTYVALTQEFSKHILPQEGQKLAWWQNHFDSVDEKIKNIVEEEGNKHYPESVRRRIIKLVSGNVELSRTAEQAQSMTDLAKEPQFKNITALAFAVGQLSLAIGEYKKILWEKEQLIFGIDSTGIESMKIRNQAKHNIHNIQKKAQDLYQHMVHS